MTEHPATTAGRIDDDALAEHLIGLERSRREALVADDMAQFAPLVAEDVVHVHTTGIVHDKPALLRHVGEFLRFLSVERGPLMIRRLGPDTAVMTGPMTNTVRRRDGGAPVVVEAFVTQVWACRDGVWQIASFHATRLPAGPA